MVLLPSTIREPAVMKDLSRVRSVEDALHTDPLLFLLPLPNSHSLLLLLVEFWLFGFVYLLPPSLLPWLTLEFRRCLLLLRLLLLG